MQARNPANAQGIDCSHYQGNIDWMKVHDSGKSFAIIKSTEGAYMVDDYLSINLTGAKAAGLAVGVYHFCRASNPGDALIEANFFCKVLDGLGGINSLDIPPILDIETIEGTSKEQISLISLTWLSAVESRYGIKPLIYTYPSFADAYLDTSLNNYPLWFADYSGATTPQDHAGFGEWTFLQYTDRGIVPGISGPVDCSEYKGGSDELLYKLNKADADKIITVLQSIHGLTTTDADKAEVHRLANEMRRASCQPVT
jgi:lysozyme